MGIAPQTRVTCATDWSLHGNTIQIQYNSNTNTIEIQHNSNTNTMQIREEYLMGAEPIGFFHVELSIVTVIRCFRQMACSEDRSNCYVASWEFLPHGSIVQCFFTKLQNNYNTQMQYKFITNTIQIHLRVCICATRWPSLQASLTNLTTSVESELQRIGFQLCFFGSHESANFSLVLLNCLKCLITLVTLRPAWWST